MKKFSYTKSVLYLIVISAIIRSFLAYILELSSEESYYWTFALYPELSNFDQPPMIGWFIQLFTSNLLFDSEFFVRFASVVCGSANIWIVFIIGRKLKGEQTGFYSAVLFTISFYLSIISGVFILPETPQTLFYLLGLYFLLEGIITRESECSESKIICRMAMIMAGIFIGLAILSKFSSILLWAGVFVYGIFYQRSIFKKPEVYISFIISILFLIPVYIWNFRNNFMGVDYISSLTHLSDGFNFRSLIWALIIPFLINNPVNLIIISKALAKYNKERFLAAPQMRLLLSLSLPVIILSIGLSAFSDSFIYAVSLGISPLVFIAGAYISNIVNIRNTKVIPGILKSGIWFFIIALFLSLLHLFTGVFNTTYLPKDEQHKLGMGDITTERYGWRELSSEFGKIRELDIALGKISEKSYILEFGFKEAAHAHYYLARPNNTVVKTTGDVGITRKYAWITRKLGGVKLGESVYCIESSANERGIEEFGKKYFEKTELASTLYIFRMNQPVVRYKIFRLINLKEIPLNI